MIPRLALAGLIFKVEQVINGGMKAVDIKPEQLARCTMTRSEERRGASMSVDAP